MKLKDSAVAAATLWDIARLGPLEQFNLFRSREG